jgi:hypothetical protein
MIEEGEEVVAPKDNSKTQDESNSKRVEVSFSMDMPSPTC